MSNFTVYLELKQYEETRNTDARNIAGKTRKADAASAKMLSVCI